jgi:hypothetical protein
VLTVVGNFPYIDWGISLIAAPPPSTYPHWEQTESVPSAIGHSLPRERAEHCDSVARLRKTVTAIYEILGVAARGLPKEAP